MMDVITNKIDTLSNLISPRRDNNKPIYNWHSFKHSFSKELVDTFISEFDLKKGNWVMDPFCGGGTTLLACKEAGLNAHGYDVLPFSVFLSNVKTADYNILKLKRAKKKFEQHKERTSYSGSLPNIPILKKAFNQKTEHQLLQIKHQINQINDASTRNFFNLGFLSILESVSNTSKSGGFLRIVERSVEADKIRSIFMDRVQAMIIDVETSTRYNHLEKTNIKAFTGDARKIVTEKKYDAIITSPPYPNRHDYTRIYSLELSFDFIKNNNELKQIRYNSLRSHVEAKKKYDAVGYRQPLLLRNVISLLEKRDLNNSHLISMLNGYFEDMHLVLLEMENHLKNKGKIALVVSNVQFAGINIPVDEILSEIGTNIGLRPKGIWLARYRGNSSQQMKIFKRIPSRESIVIWEK